jgi:ribonuclease HII
MKGSLTFEYEQQYWRQGIVRLAGIDEAGMGALAGPVVAAAVVFDSSLLISGEAPAIRDSKKLSAAQRERAATWIKQQALAWGVGEASVAEITALNIRAASHLAMRRAIEQLSVSPELLLVDGTPAQVHPAIAAVTIIDGDASVFSIAAASILAKVHRDAIMLRLAEEYPAYEWGSNKGYGSRLHLAILDSQGPTPHHRPTYAPVARLLTVGSS